VTSPECTMDFVVSQLRTMHLGMFSLFCVDVQCGIYKWRARHYQV